MAKTHKKTGIANTLPGTIYPRNGRYWYKVQFPGELKTTARPLKPIGAQYATMDYNVAVEIARNLYQQAIYQGRAGNIDRVSSIASLVCIYLKHARAYYKDADGNPTREPENIEYACKPLIELFAAMLPEEFGPLKLIELQNHLIQLNWSRGVINQRIGMIKRMFKWAVARQYVSPVLYHGLMAVEGLRRGRSAARDTARIKPVEENHVYAILPYTTPVVAAMVQLQLLTGMRPTEVCMMRPCDIDRSGKIWHYRPPKHKNLYRDIERIVSIGPKGQEILMPFLLRPAELYCFSPLESENYRRTRLTENRITPVSYGNTVGSNRKENPKVQPGQVYDSESYRKSIAHAVYAANKVIKETAKKEGIIKPELIPNWTPYQMRHTAATKVRREMGYETAGATLGHTNMSATAIYAERNQGLADEAARRLG